MARTSMTLRYSGVPSFDSSAIDVFHAGVATSSSTKFDLYSPDGGRGGGGGGGGGCGGSRNSIANGLPVTPTAHFQPQPPSQRQTGPTFGEIVVVDRSEEALLPPLQQDQQQHQQGKLSVDGHISLEGAELVVRRPSSGRALHLINPTALMVAVVELRDVAIDHFLLQASLSSTHHRDVTEHV